MTEVILEEVLHLNPTVVIMFDDNGMEFGDQTSLDDYTNDLNFSSCLKNMFIDLLEKRGEDFAVGKTLIYNPNALDGIIVRLV